MLNKRSQGRPTRDGDLVGRKRLVDGTKAFLREKSYFDCSRKTLAEFIGITPALISYYFPDRDGLIDAAITPIVERYRDDMNDILLSEIDKYHKLLCTINLFTTMHFMDGGIVDCYEYIQARSKGVTDRNALQDLFQLSERAFISCLPANDATEIDSASLTQMAWGMCRSMRAKESDQIKSCVSIRAEMIQKKTALVMQIIASNLKI